MYTTQQALAFVETLSATQRQMLCAALHLADDAQERELAFRLCEMFLLLRTVRSVARWPMSR